MPDPGFTRDRGLRDILESHPVKDMLTGRKTSEQHFRGEVALRQRVRRRCPDDGLDIATFQVRCLEELGHQVGSSLLHVESGGQKHRDDLVPVQKHAL